MLGGFFDMAPLAATSASHTVLHDLLVKEKSITEQSDKNKIKNLIAGVENINQTYAAVYAESNCGKDLYYYNTKGQNETQNPNFTAGNHFVDFNKTFDCKTMAAEIEKNRLEFMKYYNGTLPIPTNTTTSPLRSIYAFVRSSSQCIPGNSLLNGDRILMMVFSDAVKENFAEVFGDVTKKADSEFKFLDAFLGKYNPKGAPMKQLKDYLAKNKNKYFSPTADVLKTKDRKQIKEMISFLDGLVKQPVFLNDKNFAKKAENLKKLEFDMETYLYQMDPSCMDALEWHEHEPGHKPHTYCSPKN